MTSVETRNRPNATRAGNLADQLREAILSGIYAPGARLPTGVQLASQYNASRTVVREAIARLQADGLVEARQGSGVYVLDASKTESGPFQHIDFKQVSTVLELLELRAVVEVGAAALAAQRRSPAQEQRLMQCLDDLATCIREQRPTVEADFALHLAIADATNNPRFREFLVMMGRNIIPRAGLSGGSSEIKANLEMLQREHTEIVDAILEGDVERAGQAMQVHLVEGRQRYRSLLRHIVK